MIGWIELPAPADSVMDRAGNVLAGTVVTVKLQGTEDHSYHAADVNGNDPQQGSLIALEDGSIGTAAGRRYFPSGQAVDIECTDGQVVNIRTAQSVAASAEAVVNDILDAP